MILYSIKPPHDPPERPGYPVLNGVLVKSKAIADRFAANGCRVSEESTIEHGYVIPDEAFEGEADWAESRGYKL
jgi:hypothetical protein